jgi:hypothetical protein
MSDEVWYTLNENEILVSEPVFWSQSKTRIREKWINVWDLIYAQFLCKISNKIICFQWKRHGLPPEK